MNAWLASRIGHGADARALFPPRVIVEIKALACQLPKELGVPFSSLTSATIANEAVQRGIVARISGVTVWRLLSSDAIKPWTHRSWIWPRDPDFIAKACPVLDLYHGMWQNVPLGPNEYVLCADEKTSIQARKRIHPGRGPRPGHYRQVEFEYERKGALAYLAAWDVHRGQTYGLCRQTSGISSFQDLVDLVMSAEPYRSATRVFWITDNGSSHRGDRARKRLIQAYPNAVLVHLPIHASWLNQVEIYFSIVQRKVLNPNEFNDLGELEDCLMRFQVLYNSTARPFHWTFTKHDLKRVLKELREQSAAVAVA